MDIQMDHRLLRNRPSDGPNEKMANSRLPPMRSPKRKHRPYITMSKYRIASNMGCGNKINARTPSRRRHRSRNHRRPKCGNRRMEEAKQSSPGVHSSRPSPKKYNVAEPSTWLPITGMEKSTSSLLQPTEQSGIGNHLGCRTPLPSPQKRAATMGPSKLRPTQTATRPSKGYSTRHRNTPTIRQGPGRPTQDFQEPP